MTEYDVGRETFTGSDCSGSNGDSGRVLTLTGSNIEANSIILVLDTQTLVQGAGKDYTYASNNITFTNKVWDAQDIQVSYLSETSSTTTTLLAN